MRTEYEAALDQHDYAARWADYDEDADDIAGGDEGDPTEPAPRDWSAPARPAVPDDPVHAAAHAAAAPELDAMLAEREEELTALRTAMDALEAGLRGPGGQVTPRSRNG